MMRTRSKFLVLFLVIMHWLGYEGFHKKMSFFGGHGKNRSLKSLIHGVLGHGMWYEFT